MSRSQRKCILASVCLHGLLCLVVVIGPALMPRKEDDRPVVMTFLNAALTDDRSGGGAAGPVAPALIDPPAPTPTATPEVAKPAPEQPKKIEDPKLVEPPPPKVVEKPKAEEIPKVPEGERKLPLVQKKTVEPTKTAVQDSLKRPIVPARKVEARAVVKTLPKVDLTKTAKRDAQTLEDEKARADAAREAERRRQIAAGLGKSASNIQRNTSKAAAVEATGSGDGSGGQAAINYRQYVAARYKSEYDDALARASGIAAGDLVVRASVTINSSGRVVASEIITRSGNKELDRLVQHILDGVKQIEGFPPGAQDSERTFKLRFHLDSESRQG